MLKIDFYFSRLAVLMQLKYLIIFICWLFTSLHVSAQTKGEKFEPPKEADNLKNLITPDAASLKEAKTIYTGYCTPCHGDKGEGNGIAAAGLSIKPADHTSVAVQNQTDGALFWEMTTGHNPMPSYKLMFTEKQRWELVNYIRTLAKKPKH